MRRVYKWIMSDPDEPKLSHAILLIVAGLIGVFTPLVPGIAIMCVGIYKLNKWNKYK